MMNLIDKLQLDGRRVRHSAVYEKILDVSRLCLNYTNPPFPCGNSLQGMKFDARGPRNRASHQKSCVCPSTGPMCYHFRHSNH